MYALHPTLCAPQKSVHEVFPDYGPFSSIAAPQHVFYGADKSIAAFCFRVSSTPHVGKTGEFKLPPHLDVFRCVSPNAGEGEAKETNTERNFYAVRNVSIGHHVYGGVFV